MKKCLKNLKMRKIFSESDNFSADDSFDDDDIDDDELYEDEDEEGKRKKRKCSEEGEKDVGRKR